MIPFIFGTGNACKSRKKSKAKNHLQMNNTVRCSVSFNGRNDTTRGYQHSAAPDTVRPPYRVPACPPFDFQLKPCRLATDTGCVAVDAVCRRCGDSKSLGQPAKRRRS